MLFALKLPAAALALLAGGFTWLVTALGAAAVFFFSRENERLMTARERQEAIEKLEKEMKKASKMLEFEYAAVLRDRIIKLRGEKD